MQNLAEQLRGAAERVGVMYSGHRAKTPRIDRLVAAARRMLLPPAAPAVIAPRVLSANHRRRWLQIRALHRAQIYRDKRVYHTLFRPLQVSNSEDRSDCATLMDDDLHITARPTNPLRHGWITPSLPYSKEH